MRALLILMLLLIPKIGIAQFTYFNQTIGENDANSVLGNVEVIGDDIFVFGRSTSENSSYYHISKYDLDGIQTNSKVYTFPNEFLYMGLTASFRKLNDETGFVLAQQKADSIGSHSYLMYFDMNLDTVWTKEYVFNSEYSGFDTFVEGDEGFVLVGFYQDAWTQFGGGSYIQKLDFEGNILWDEVLHPHESESYSHRNKNIIESDDGFVLGGHKNSSFGSNLISEGVITLVDSIGQDPLELDNIEEGLNSTRYYLLQMSNNDIICAHGVYYEESTGGTYFSKTKIYKLNVGGQNFYWEHEYLLDEHIKGTPIIPKETIDGGIILMGGRWGEDLAYYSTLLKLDSLGNQEWYKEYYYEDCGECYNLMWDYEITSDGGYILVGEFYNWDNLPDKKAWMLKLDACGDVEWEGCDYVGVSEINRPSNLVVYPNPANEWLSIEGDLSSNSEVMIYDVSGKLIHKEILRIETKIDVSFLTRGLYLLSIVEENGNGYSEKLIKN